MCDAFADGHTANYAHAHTHTDVNSHSNSDINSHAKAYSDTEATPRSAGSPNTALKRRSISDWPSGLTRR